MNDVFSIFETMEIDSLKAICYTYIEKGAADRRLAQTMSQR